jgi:hypothetical protein
MAYSRTGYVWIGGSIAWARGAGLVALQDPLQIGRFRPTATVGWLAC